MRHVRLMILSDTDPHEIPDGWFLHSAVPLRTTGVHATVALILVEIPTRKKLSVDDYKKAAVAEEPSNL